MALPGVGGSGPVQQPALVMPLPGPQAAPGIEAIIRGLAMGGLPLGQLGKLGASPALPTLTQRRIPWLTGMPYLQG